MDASNDQSKIYTCKYCLNVFTKKRKWRRHKQRHLTGDSKKSSLISAEMRNQPPGVGKNLTDNSIKTKISRSSHNSSIAEVSQRKVTSKCITPEPNMKCPVPGCVNGTCYKTASSFRKHWTQTHCRKVKCFVCNICSKAISHLCSNDMKKHLKTHNITDIGKIGEAPNPKHCHQKVMKNALLIHPQGYWLKKDCHTGSKRGKKIRSHQHASDNINNKCTKTKNGDSEWVKTHKKKQTKINMYYSHDIAVHEANQSVPSHTHDIAVQQANQSVPSHTHDIAVHEANQSVPSHTHDIAVHEANQSVPSHTHDIAVQQAREMGASIIQGKTYTCKYCLKVFKKKQILRFHLQNHLAVGSKRSPSMTPIGGEKPLHRKTRKKYIKLTKHHKKSKISRSSNINYISEIPQGKDVSKCTTTKQIKCPVPASANVSLYNSGSMSCVSTVMVEATQTASSQIPPSIHTSDNVHVVPTTYISDISDTDHLNVSSHSLSRSYTRTIYVPSRGHGHGGLLVSKCIYQPKVGRRAIQGRVLQF